MKITKSTKASCHKYFMVCSSINYIPFKSICYFLRWKYSGYYNAAIRQTERCMCYYCQDNTYFSVLGIPYIVMGNVFDSVFNMCVYACVFVCVCVCVCVCAYMHVLLQWFLLVLLNSQWHPVTIAKHGALLILLQSYNGDLAILGK